MAERRDVAILLNRTIAYFREILAGIGQYANTLGHWRCFGQPRRIVLPIADMALWKGDGLIVPLPVAEIDAKEALKRYPIVNVSARLAFPLVPSALPDNVAVGRMQAEHMLERGLRSIVFAGSEHMVYSLERQAGCQAVAEAAGAKFKYISAAAFNDSNPRQREDILRLIDEMALPLAVCAANDEFGHWVVAAAQAAGFRVPDDIAVVGVDNDEMVCSFCDPPLSSVDVNARRVGYEAALLLDRLMAGEEVSDIHIAVAPKEVVQRRSTDILAVSDTSVSEAMAFIRDHAATEMTIEQVVTSVGVSRRSLEMRFRLALGRSILDQIHTARVQRAQELMRMTDLSLRQVAAKCGFSDYRQMGSVFQRIVGEKPSVWRNRMRM